MYPHFSDRNEAGRQLAAKLAALHGTDGVVLGLPRGGVAVAAPVAQALDMPLQALVVRKLGAPHQPELAIGAVSETGLRWLDDYLVRATGATERYIEQVTAREVAEARRRTEEYRHGAALDDIRGKRAIVVDDGIATGATALAGVLSARALGAAEVILATPVASHQAVEMLSGKADRIVTIAVPDPFIAVGMYYDDFDQVTDEEVMAYLEDARG